MKRSDELRDLKAQKLGQMQEIADAAKGRQLNAEERAKYDGLKDEVKALNVDIDDAVALEEEQRKSAEQQKPRPQRSTGGEAGEQKRIVKGYSLLRAMKNGGVW